MTYSLSDAPRGVGNLLENGVGHIREKRVGRLLEKSGPIVGHFPENSHVLIRQCLNRRIECLGQAQAAVLAWQIHRDNLNAKVYWQFTARDARVKLRRLYPTL